MLAGLFCVKLPFSYHKKITNVIKCNFSDKKCILNEIIKSKNYFVQNKKPSKDIFFEGFKLFGLS